MESNPTLLQYFSHPMAWLLLVVYFFPTIMAMCHKSSGWAGCFWVNLFFGWTLVGWFICLLLGNAPTKKQLEYREEVRRAKDSYYLREQEKASKS